jgi:hypothetical protein
MPYRQAPQPPKKEPRPVERLVVSRYGIYPAIALVVGSIAFISFLVYSSYEGTQLVCTRAAAGATPVCQATEIGTGPKSFDSFELAYETLSLGNHDGDAVVHTPTGDLARGVDLAFAQSTIGRARKFVATPGELRFEARQTTSGSSLFFALGGIVFVSFLLLLVRRKVLEVDRDAGVVRVGKGDGEYALSEVVEAKVEEIDDSEFKKLVLVKKDESTVVIADGREEECTVAANAINRASRELARERGEEDADEVDAELTVEEKWQQAEGLLRTLPLDGAEIARDDDERRAEARGKRRGFEVRAVVDPIHPSGIEIDVVANSRADIIDIHYDATARAGDEKWPDRVFFADGVFVDDEEEAIALRSFPEALRERIVMCMSAYDVRSLGIDPEMIHVSSREPRDLRDPAGRTAAMIELAVDIAEAAAKLPAT